MKYFFLLVLSLILKLSVAHAQENELYNLGVKALKESKYKEAINFFEKDIAKRNYSYSAFGLGLAYEKVYEFSRARQAYGLALDLSPQLDEKSSQQARQAVRDFSSTSKNARPNSLTEWGDEWFKPKKKFGDGLLILGVKSNSNPQDDILKSLIDHQ